MLLIKLFNLIRGYIIIEVAGMFTERFLNICTKRGIHLWNVCRIDNWKIRANISIRGFKMLRPIAKKSRCKVCIIEKCGCPFVVFKYRHRKAFVFGVVIFAFLIYYMSSFIWMINISGNDRITTRQILDTLLESGIKAGMKKTEVDKDFATRQMMTKLPDAAWISINLKGSTVIVDIEERTELPPLFDKDLPCNIIAKNDGVIEEINVTNGVKLVKINDVVRKGQVLVSGVIESEKTGLRLVHSDGEVFARTWYEESFDLPVIEEVKTITGKNKSKHSLKIFNNYVKLYLDDRVSFENYERVSYVKNFFWGNNNILPIAFHHDGYAEQSITYVEHDGEDALDYITEMLDEKYAGYDVQHREVVIEDGTIKAVYECIENIGEKVDLVISDQ